MSACPHALHTGLGANIRARFPDPEKMTPDQAALLLFECKHEDRHRGVHRSLRGSESWSGKLTAEELAYADGLHQAILKSLVHPDIEMVPTNAQGSPPESASAAAAFLLKVGRGGSVRASAFLPALSQECSIPFDTAKGLLDVALRTGEVALTGNFTLQPSPVLLNRSYVS